MPCDVEYTDEFETWWNRLTRLEHPYSSKVNGFSELTKDWSPERVARNEAKVRLTR